MKGALSKSRDVLRSARDAQRFARLQPHWRHVVFYSEGGSYAKYFRPVVDALITHENMHVAYLTSDRRDPILAERNDRIAAFYIGSGSVCIWVFRTLRAAVLVTTTPDLQSLHLKRSMGHPVHYTYLHHSLVSTHRIYRTGAFDHFDSVLCAGPHHQREIRAWEELNELPRKALYAHGYGPLEWLLAEGAGSFPEFPRDGGLSIILAPSWGPTGLIELGAEPIINGLLQAGHRVVVRPHPMTTRLHGRALGVLASSFGSHPRFSLEDDTTTMKALLNAHIMVSDWSGVAMEFAFGLRRPVLFVDTPRKINNSRWAELGLVPLEESYRSEVGEILTIERAEDVPQMVNALWANRSAYATRIDRLRDQHVYNIGTSGQVGARIIAELVKQNADALQHSI